MKPLTPSQIRRILEVTDAAGIHREAVVIPLAGEGAGAIERIERNRIQITAPESGLLDWQEPIGFVRVGD